jgi:hypothetical protein
MATLHELGRQDLAGRIGTPWRETAEVELLLCLARAHLGPEEGARLEALLQTPINWDDFLKLAERHRLLPLCTRHLNALAGGQVPAASMQAMRGYTERNLRRSLLLTGELHNILRVFGEAGIPALPFKGPVLAAYLYGSIALRDMLDLDVLVTKQDAVRARDLLFERGYRSAVPTGERWDEYLLWSGCNFTLLHEGFGLVVELHWTPEACLSDREVAELWQRSEYVSLTGMKVATFARQDLLLLMCLHGSRHMWERLEWVVGVAEVLRSHAVSWDRALEDAGSLGGRRALYLGVVLAHGLLGAPVPDRILQRIRAERGMSRLTRAACHQLFCETPTLAHQLGLQFHGFQLRSKDRLRDRVRYIGRRGLARIGQDWLTRTSAAVTFLPDWADANGRCTTKRDGSSRPSSQSQL